MHTRKHLFGVVGMLLLLLGMLTLGASPSGAVVTNFAFDSTLIGYGGINLSATPSAFSGHNYFLVPVNQKLDTTITGTQATIGVNTCNLSVSVDGGAFATVTTAGGGWTTDTLFTGLADTAHHVIIITLAQGYLDVGGAGDTQGGLLQVTGAAPALALPSGYGPHYVLNPNANSTSPAFIAIDSGVYAYNTTIGIYPTTIVPQGLGGQIRFRATCSEIHLWCYYQGQAFTLYVDGAAQSPATQADTGAFGDLVVGAGLDNTAPHEYKIVHTGGPTGRTPYVYDLMLVGNSSPLAAVSHSSPEQWLFSGDSITYGSGVTTPLTQAWPSLLTAAKSVAAANFGVSGSTTPSTAPGYTAIMGGAPTRIFILYGTNDFGGSVTVSTFTTNYTTLITSLANAYPAAKIYCLAILPRSGVDASALAPYISAIQSDAASYVAAHPTRTVQYITTIPWALNGTTNPNYLASTSNYTINYLDGLHPNVAGNTIMSNRLIQTLFTSLFRSRSSGGLRAGSRSPF